MIDYEQYRTQEYATQCASLSVVYNRLRSSGSRASRHITNEVFTLEIVEGVEHNDAVKDLYQIRKEQGWELTQQCLHCDTPSVTIMCSAGLRMLLRLRMCVRCPCDIHELVVHCHGTNIQENFWIIH
jgi:hypothetical protein